jgi:hypothetical protein
LEFFFVQALTEAGVTRLRQSYGVARETGGMRQKEKWNEEEKIRSTLPFPEAQGESL